MSVMAPELPALQAAYMGAVRDSALVFTQPAHAMRKITGSLFDGPSCTGELTVTVSVTNHRST